MMEPANEKASAGQQPVRGNPSKSRASQNRHGSNATNSSDKAGQNGTPTDVVQPHDLQAEVGVLGSIILDPSVRVEVKNIISGPSAFFDAANQKIYRGLLALKKIDPTLLIDQLRAAGDYESIGAAYLSKVINGVPNAAHAGYYAEIVNEKCCFREAERLAVEVRAQITNGRPLDEVEARISNHAEQIRESRKRASGPKTMKELISTHQKLRPPVIHGLLREGETMNIIAPAKTGKSWLVTGLALSVVTGADWLGIHPTVSGKVLILDNELHPETSADRIPKVAAGLSIPQAHYDDSLFVESMRGSLQDICKLDGYFQQFDAGQFKLIILDALYRFLPPGVDENDNAKMAAIYNQIDAYAGRLRCAFALIHHSSKGNQSGKGITDVGAGAGSQARAADTHLILRPHEEDGVMVLDAAARSWKPIAPLCLRWVFPIWTPATDLDPADLKKDRSRKAKDDEPGSRAFSVESFVAEFVTAEPQARTAIVNAACAAGLKPTTAEKLLRRAAADGLIHRWKGIGSDGRNHVFATSPQPPQEVLPNLTT